MTKEEFITNINIEETVIEIIEDKKINDITDNTSEWIIRMLIEKSSGTGEIITKQYYINKDNIYVR